MRLIDADDKEGLAAANRESSRAFTNRMKEIDKLTKLGAIPGANKDVKYIEYLKKVENELIQNDD